MYEPKENEEVLSSMLSYKEGVAENEGAYSYQDFQAIQSGFSNNKRIKEQVIVRDYGKNIMTASEEEAELMILVIGGKPWEVENSIRAYEQLAGEESLVIVCNYNNKQMARKYASVFQKKIYCFPLDADPFSITKEKHRLFQQISKEGRE